MICKRFSGAVFFGLIVFVATSAVYPGDLHNYHTSLTRMDYNEKENLFEVTIRLFSHDLDPLLAKLSAKQSGPDKTADPDKVLFDYIRENFILTGKDASVHPLVWVGKETKVDVVYVYMEIPYNGGQNDLSLQNILFFESFPEQTNYVVAHFSGAKADLVYKVGDKARELKFIDSRNFPSEQINFHH